MDNGSTWTPLVSGQSITIYEWDTTTVPDGTSYQLKVVATCADGLTVEVQTDTYFTIQNQVPITTSDVTITTISPTETIVTSISTVEAFSHPGGFIVVLVVTMFLIILPILRIKHKFRE